MLDMKSPSVICSEFNVTEELEENNSGANLQKLVHDVQFFLAENGKAQSTLEVEVVLKKLVYQGKSIHPRKFCRRWFGLEDIGNSQQPYYTEDLILAIEFEHGYREKCINLIARVLKIKPNTVHRWGKGVEFDKIPADKREQYEIYLGYVDTMRNLIIKLVELKGCL